MLELIQTFRSSSKKFKAKKLGLVDRFFKTGLFFVNRFCDLKMKPVLKNHLLFLNGFKKPVSVQTGFLKPIKNNKCFLKS